MENMERTGGNKRDREDDDPFDEHPEDKDIEAKRQRLQSEGFDIAFIENTINLDLELFMTPNFHGVALKIFMGLDFVSIARLCSASTIIHDYCENFLGEKFHRAVFFADISLLDPHWGAWNQLWATRKTGQTNEWRKPFDRILKSAEKHLLTYKLLENYKSKGRGLIVFTTGTISFTDADLWKIDGNILNLLGKGYKTPKGDIIQGYSVHNAVLEPPESLMYYDASATGNFSDEKGVSRFYRIGITKMKNGGDDKKNQPCHVPITQFRFGRMSAAGKPILLYTRVAYVATDYSNRDLETRDTVLFDSGIIHVELKTPTVEGDLTEKITVNGAVLYFTVSTIIIPTGRSGKGQKDQSVQGITTVSLRGLEFLHISNAWFAKACFNRKKREEFYNMTEDEMYNYSEELGKTRPEYSTPREMPEYWRY